MKTVEFIRNCLEGSARAVLPMIEDMKDLAFTFPTPRGGSPQSLPGPSRRDDEGAEYPER